jgi:hypothetical protein
VTATIIILDDHRRIRDFLTTLDDVIDKGVVLLDDVKRRPLHRHTAPAVATGTDTRSGPGLPASMLLASRRTLVLA